MDNLDPRARQTLCRAGSLVLAAALAACVTTPAERPTVSRAPDTRPIYKVGNPYQIAGIWYYPREQPDYEETGIASWYGAAFQGLPTANGEIFDKNLITAAHPTLPMPVHVRVTNLENGRALVVRVNDRGPFKSGRLIDVSEHAAQLLGFRERGTARVRVTYLNKAPLDGLLPPPQIIAQQPAAPQFRRASADVAQAELLDDVPSGDRSIYVSAGAYTSLENANRVVEKLRSVGAQLLPGTFEGHPLYRVRIGPIDTPTEAYQVLTQVTALGHNGAAIIVE